MWYLLAKLLTLFRCNTKKSSNMYEYNRNLAYRYSNTQRKNDICLIQNEEEFDLLKEVLL